MSSNVLKLDLNSARRIPKLMNIDQSYAALTTQSLCTTIGPLQDNWRILPYNRNITLQTLELFSAFTFARLYNAATSPASRLRSAGSLAIKKTVLQV